MSQLKTPIISIVVGFINLREGTEWLKYKTGKDISIKGLQRRGPAKVAS